ncbi:aromatic ring-hydroxylating oxygenase subunit alpha [Puniceibacterium confluentis]|uniref:aromatic ring-hydroxylating oxygenase subunit alpha n=1 Tax=Puniceibacterium confluentis TaxID=1958944 RepID=UPI001FE8149A|nr:aromatic ring-hydroxylating dioxygenase subunit alpha [Puniceibacterium confluentis]
MNEQVTQGRFDAARIREMRQTLAECAAADADAPQGLPGRFYTDPAFFDHECDTVLRHNWHCVGRVDEFAEQGDYLALNLFGEPIIIVRDGDAIKALSNVCRHRGMPLAEGHGNAKRFVCRYHAWAYGTDGVLLRAPRMKNAGFDPKTCKLGEFGCVQRFGFVYVSLSPTPPDIDVELAGLNAVIGRYEPEQYTIVHRASEVWNCNWKALVENFMEGYHLSVVHPQTLHGYTPTGLSRKGPSGAGFTSYFANYPDNIPPRGEGAAGLSKEERQRSTLFAAFPCQVVSVAASLLVSLSIRPLTPTSIEVRWTMSVFGNSLDGDTIDQRIALWQDVNREDREKLEAMQSALGSIHATGGPLAEEDYEGTVRDFLLWLAAQDAGLN